MPNIGNKVDVNFIWDKFSQNLWTVNNREINRSKIVAVIPQKNNKIKLP